MGDVVQRLDQRIGLIVISAAGTADEFIEESRNRAETDACNPIVRMERKAS